MTFPTDLVGSLLRPRPGVSILLHTPDKNPQEVGHGLDEYWSDTDLLVLPCVSCREDVAWGKVWHVPRVLTLAGARDVWFFGGSEFDRMVEVVWSGGDEGPVTGVAPAPADRASG